MKGTITKVAILAHPILSFNMLGIRGLYYCLIHNHEFLQELRVW